MKRFLAIVALTTLSTSCGWICSNDSTKSVEESVAAPEAMDVDIMAKYESADVEAMNIEERVDYYLSRFVYESSFEDKSHADTTRCEMMEWLQSLSDEDKRRADDASDVWYEKNAHRF